MRVTLPVTTEPRFGLGERTTFTSVAPAGCSVPAAAVSSGPDYVDTPSPTTTPSFTSRRPMRFSFSSIFSTLTSISWPTVSTSFGCAMRRSDIAEM